ncbi:unnamed protein product [Clonostachys rhizophaga]|uniref:Uncharacterized protein n=1 Tax=Clonostachys rhizophaga TaxID=160324 RepID=A0A9N9VKJ6_9HYPO|nr:unnamed protein product [Clonostachys rhizophaga]
MAAWSSSPTEIRFLFLKTLMWNGCRLSNAATVPREWQNINRKSYRNRCDGSVSTYQHLVRYLYLCIEMKEYDCSKCKNNEMPLCSKLCYLLFIQERQSPTYYLVMEFIRSLNGALVSLSNLEADITTDDLDQYLQRRQQYCARLMTSGMGEILLAKGLSQQSQLLKSFMIRSWPMHHLIQMKKILHSSNVPQTDVSILLLLFGSFSGYIRPPAAFINHFSSYSHLRNWISLWYLKI